MIRYKTILKEARAEHTIDRSRFIVHVCPVETREEAEEFISKIKSIHKDATHNVPAMVLGDKFQIQWGSDDGEPQGTSGAPIVQMMVKEELTNIALVVTRYFGGVKLGTGGLVRAYTGTAKMGLEAGGICSVKDMTVFCAKLEYTYLSKLQNMAGGGDFEIKKLIYEEVITAVVATEPEKAETLKADIANLTNGNGVISHEHMEQVKVLL